ncbi:LrgB family protein [Salibacterium aidingense]|uniref:LrgB family protein n=1 Tax=Salibacterium aidingense TaxID=384933 RepID=UPI003BBAE10B
MAEWGIALPAIIGTVAVYYGSRVLYKRFPFPFLLPIVTGTAVIVLFLAAAGISYPAYMIGGKWIEHLLGPAVVALAIPLYKQREVLKMYAVPVMGGVTAGAAAGILSGYFPAKWAGIEENLIAAVLPKSVTTPVAMEVSASTGGAPALAAVFVMVAGIGGVVSAAAFFKWCGIRHELARGIALGSASHAIGTAKALENGEREGTASSVAMTLSAVLISVLIPSLAFILF